MALVPPPRANQVHIRCGAARGAGVSVAASGSGSSEDSEGTDASVVCGASSDEACAGAVPLAVLECAVLACFWSEWVCVPEVWGGDGASGGGASSVVNDDGQMYEAEVVHVDYTQVIAP